MLKEENFQNLKQCFTVNNNCLKIEEFVIAMVENFTNYRSKLQFVKNLVELFKEIDLDGNGILEFKELLQYIVDYQNKNILESMGSKQDVQKVIDMYAEKNTEFDKFRISEHYLSDFNISQYEWKFHSEGNKFILAFYTKGKSNIDLYINSFDKMISFDLKELLWKRLKYHTFDININIVDLIISEYDGLMYILLENHLIILDIILGQVTKTFELSDATFTSLRIVKSDVILLMNQKKQLVFFKLKEKLIQTQIFTINARYVKGLKTTESDVYCFDELGCFYTIKYSKVNGEFYMLPYSRPLKQHLIKDYFVMPSISVYIFWGYCNFFMVYLSSDFNKNPKKLILHRHEIKRCKYLSEYDKMISVDEGNVVILWNQNDFTKHQVIIPRAPVIDLQIFKNNSALMFLTQQGIYTAELTQFEEYKSNIHVLSFFYNEFIRKFILVTNMDTRFIDVLTGDIVHFITNDKYKFLKGSKLVDIAFGSQDISEKPFQYFTKPGNTDKEQLLQLQNKEYSNAYDQSFRLMMVESNYTLSIFNMKNFEKIKEVAVYNGDDKCGIDMKDNHVDLIKCIKYTSYLDSYIIGYHSSAIKIFSTEVKHTNSWIRKLLGGHRDSPVSFIDTRAEIIISGAKNGSLAVWNISKGSGHMLPVLNTSKVTCIKILQNNNFISFHKDHEAYHWILTDDFNIKSITKVKFGMKKETFTTCSLVHQDIIYIGTSTGELIAIDCKKSSILRDDCENKPLNNPHKLKLREIINCSIYTKEFPYGYDPDDLKTLVVLNTVKVDKQKIKNLRFESSFNLINVFTKNVIQLYSLNLQLICLIDIRTSTTRDWNISLDWIEWEVYDLEQAFKLLEAIEDKKINREEREVQMIKYFRENYLNLKGILNKKVKQLLRGKRFLKIIGKDEDPELNCCLNTLQRKSNLMSNVLSTAKKQVIKTKSRENKRIEKTPAKENKENGDKEKSDLSTKRCTKNNLANFMNEDDPSGRMLSQKIVNNDFMDKKKLKQQNNYLKDRVKSSKKALDLYRRDTLLKNKMKQDIMPISDYKLNFDINKRIDFKYSEPLKTSLNQPRPLINSKSSFKALEIPKRYIIPESKRQSATKEVFYYESHKKREKSAMQKINYMDLEKNYQSMKKNQLRSPRGLNQNDKLRLSVKMNHNTKSAKIITEYHIQDRNTLSPEHQVRASKSQFRVNSKRRTLNRIKSDYKDMLISLESQLGN